MLNNFESQAVDMIIDFLADNPGFESWDDLHYYIFNEDYTFIYYKDARDALNEYDVFNAIEKIKEYEQFNFGEVTCDFSDPVQVANMLMYIIGEEILCKLDIDEIVDALFDDDNCEEVNERIIEEVKAVA